MAHDTGVMLAYFVEGIQGIPLCGILECWDGTMWNDMARNGMLWDIDMRWDGMGWGGMLITYDVGW